MPLHFTPRSPVYFRRYISHKLAPQSIAIPQIAPIKIPNNKFLLSNPTIIPTNIPNTENSPSYFLNASLPFHLDIFKNTRYH